MNYLLEIENAYSKGRGKQSLLTPMDWNLADQWEQTGIPLHIVLRAMGDLFKKFDASNKHGTINSLKYFKTEVEKQYAEWLSAQVGKSTEQKEEKSMPNYAFCAPLTSSVDVETLEALADGFKKSELPEPLKSAAAEIRRDLILLIEEANQKEISTDDIETRLKEIKEGLTLPLVTSISEADRAEMIANINREYANVTLTQDTRAKILNRQLYTRFGLPELTLFEI